MPTLPETFDPATNVRLVLEPAQWSALLAAILRARGLPAEDLAPFPTGSDVVWGTRQHVIKLTAPCWSDEIAAEATMLRRVRSHLGALVAEPVATGAEQGWPWVIQTRLAGTAIADVWDSLEPAQRVRVAHQTGELVARLHAIPAEPDPAWAPSLEAARARAPDRDAACGDPWREAVRAFLADVPLSDRPLVLLHTELYNQHVLVTESGAGWDVCGVIDFADGRVGHPLYEAAAVHELWMGNDAAAMAAFWTGWGIERPPPREQLAWALSHRFGILRRHLDLAGVHVVPGDLERLAETLHG